MQNKQILKDINCVITMSLEMGALIYLLNRCGNIPAPAIATLSGILVIGFEYFKIYLTNNPK